LDSVSVIVPTHNRAHLLPRAVASVLAALRPGDELIVVDDGSTDNTAEVLAPFGQRLRYFRTENRGVGPARNYGVQQARHPLVAFLDSDDEWMPDSLELRRAVMSAHPDLVFCFTDFAHKSSDGVISGQYLVNWHRDTRTWDEILAPGATFSSLASLPAERADFMVHIGNLYSGLLERCYVPAWTALVRRSLAGDDFQFAEDLPLGEEWLMFGRTARRGPIAFLNCDTAWNHGHSGARVTSDAGLIGFLSGHLTLAKRIWGTDPVFLSQEAERYRAVIAALHVQRARWFLSRGRTKEARSELLAAGSGIPMALRMLAGLPSPVLGTMGAARRLALSVMNQVRR
jgi:glycosyltransferase involved in cell wall biosynthesis